MVRVGRRRLGLIILAGAMVLVAATLTLRLASTRHQSPLDAGRSAYNRGDWDGASAFARDRLKVVPNDIEALRLYARSAVRLQHDETAKAVYSRLDNRPAPGGRAPTDLRSGMMAEDFYLLGTVLARAGDPEGARGCWETGLAIEPNHAELLHALARTYAQGDQLVRASRLAERLVQQPGWSVRGQLILGALRAELGDSAGAVDALGQALREDPNLREAPSAPKQYRKSLARQLLRLGKAADARAQLETVLNAEPDREASWLLSRALLQEGAPTRAARALEESHSYSAEHPLAPEPAPEVGSARCAQCHATNHRSEQASRHARTYEHPATLDDRLLPGRSVPEGANPTVSHTIRRDGPQLELETRVGDASYRAVVDAVFGSGDRGLTMVGHDAQGRARELRISRYPKGAVWDVTTGHPEHPASGEDHLGRLLTEDDVRRCFLCHTNEARVPAAQSSSSSALHGIGCERCHGPGGNHLKAVEAKWTDLAIARPSLATGEDVVALCAQCHSPRGKNVPPDDPTFVRFQGTTLTWSRCYSESGGELDCVTCHNPHRDVETSAAHYEAKCRSCHSRSITQANESIVPAGKGRTICPVNPANGCLDCHMPTVKTVFPHSTYFTDHHIRVHPELPGRNSSRSDRQRDAEPHSP